MRCGRGLVIVVFALIVFSGMFLAYEMGFTGTTATWNRVEWSYPGGATVSGQSTAWYIDCRSTVHADIEAHIAGQPQTIDLDEQAPILKENEDGTYDGFRWEKRKMEFKVDFQTTGFGTMSPTGMEIYLRLQNNYNSIFVDAKESLGYVYAAQVADYEVKQDGAHSSILPSSTSFFNLYSVDDGQQVYPPSAFSEVLDLAELMRLQTVDIQFLVSNFAPAVSIGFREEAHVIITIYLWVIVLGHWENVVPEHFQRGSPNQGFNFWEFIGGFLDWLQETLMLVVLVVALVVVLVFVVKRK